MLVQCWFHTFVSASVVLVLAIDPMSEGLEEKRENKTEELELSNSPQQGKDADDLGSPIHIGPRSTSGRIIPAPIFENPSRLEVKLR